MPVSRPPLVLSLIRREGVMVVTIQVAPIELVKLMIENKELANDAPCAVSVSIRLSSSYILLTVTM